MSKDVIIGPGTFALAGAAACVILGMLYCHDKDSWGRISLEWSCPLAIMGIGILIGAASGLFLALLQALWERSASVLRRRRGSQCSPSGMGLSTRYALCYLLMWVILSMLGGPGAYF